MKLEHVGVATSMILLAGAFGAVVEACGGGEDGSGTTGKRVVLRTRVIGDAAGKSTFTNGVGWSVTLRSAYLSTGALYYFDGDPIFSRAERKFDRLRRLLLPRLAFAHPGHYVPGNARGEMTVASSVDLLSAGNDLANGNGVTGPYRSARFNFGAPPTGPFASALAGHVVQVEGEATSGATTVKFKAHADVADVLDTFSEPKLDGCAFKPVEVSGDGTVTMTVLPTIWFDQVDFTDVKGDGVVDLAGTVAFNGFARGLKKGTAYVFAYAPNGQ